MEVLLMLLGIILVLVGQFVVVPYCLMVVLRLFDISINFGPALAIVILFRVLFSLWT
ncbi:hypothetical protein SDC9_172676 [bioreactor metagenome]|uniref:Uncharacterized protein n=1 Tax=bioreactor metagenome TaxID=1076179 RepID=A0A645GHN2_9ZZZZ